MPTPLSLARMVDLSIGTPELGAVNFRVLHQLLHVMVKKLNLTEFVPDLEGDFADTAATLLAAPSKSDAVPGASKSAYAALQDKVSRMERDLDRINALPTNADIMQKVQHDKPLTDLWQYMQLTKRVDAHDQGLEKLYSLVQDMIRDMRDLKKSQEQLSERLSKIDLSSINERLAALDSKLHGLSNLESKVKELDDIKKQLAAMQEQMSAYPPADVLVTWPGLEDAISGVRGEFAAYKSANLVTSASQTDPSSRSATATPTTASAAAPQRQAAAAAVTASPQRSGGGGGSVHSPSPAPSRSRSAASDGPSDDLVTVLGRLGTLDSRHEALAQRVDALEKDMQGKADRDELGSKLPDDLLDTISSLQSRMDDFVKLRDRDAEAIKKTQNAVLGLQLDLEKLQKLTDYLNNENDERKKLQEEMGRELVRLEAVKVDKEYVDKEIDVKADRNLVDSKVNYTVFDNACSDLQKMISDLLAKLAAYEDAWKNAHGKLEEDVDTKLDRSELDKLKSYIDKRLKELQSKMKQIQAGSPFCEDAAGLKRQLLPFNCLSCDKPVVVSTQAPLSAFSMDTAFAPQRSTKPYTTFELDQIRQHAKSLLHADSFVGDYYAGPRPCGGSHTTTQTSNKRLGRSAYGRDVYRDEEQLLHDTVIAPDMDIVGADGHIYKGRNESPSGGGKQQIDARLPTALQDRTAAESKRPTTSPAGARPTSARPTSSRSRTQVAAAVARANDSGGGGDDDDAVEEPVQPFVVGGQAAKETVQAAGS